MAALDTPTARSRGGQPSVALPPGGALRPPRQFHTPSPHHPPGRSSSPLTLPGPLSTNGPEHRSVLHTFAAVGSAEPPPCTYAQNYAAVEGGTGVPRAPKHILYISERWHRHLIRARLCPGEGGSLPGPVEPSPCPRAL